MTALPGWADMPDLDKAAALRHTSAREIEGDAYAVDHYPCRYRQHPALTALNPSAASAHAAQVCTEAVVDALPLAEYHRLVDLGDGNARPAPPPLPAPTVPEKPQVPAEVTAAVNQAVTAGLPAPASVGVWTPPGGVETISLDLHTAADTDRWAAHVGAAVGGDDDGRYRNSDGVWVSEYGTSFGRPGVWLGRPVVLFAEIPDPTI